MRLVRVINGVRVPYSEQQLRNDNPSMLLPRGLVGVDLSQFGVEIDPDPAALSALMCSGCVSGPAKRSSTPLPQAPVVQTVREYVRVECEAPEPPLPEPPLPEEATAQTCGDAMIEDVSAQTGPWATLMRYYVTLRECVQRHQEKADSK